MTGTRNAFVRRPPSTGVSRRVEVYPGKEVVVEFDPELTFECVDGCTWCCHHGVLLYGPDVAELAQHTNLRDATTRTRGRDFIRTDEKDHDHAAPSDEACYFLDANGRCALQAGHDWKPSRCSVFPLEITVRAGTLHVSVRAEAREHCEGLNVSTRRVIDHLDAFLPELLWELEDPTTKVEL